VGDSFTCECAAGFTGDACSEDIDECATNLCLHKGTCTDSTNSGGMVPPGEFSCQCTAEYRGKTCDSVACDFDATICLVADGVKVTAGSPLADDTHKARWLGNIAPDFEDALGVAEAQVHAQDTDATTIRFQIDCDTADECAGYQTQLVDQITNDACSTTVDGCDDGIFSEVSSADFVSGQTLSIKILGAESYMVFGGSNSDYTGRYNQIALSCHGKPVFQQNRGGSDGYVLYSASTSVWMVGDPNAGLACGDKGYIKGGCAAATQTTAPTQCASLWQERTDNEAAPAASGGWVSNSTIGVEEWKAYDLSGGTRAQFTGRYEMIATQCFGKAMYQKGGTTGYMLYTNSDREWMIGPPSSAHICKNTGYIYLQTYKADQPDDPEGDGKWMDNTGDKEKDGSVWKHPTPAIRVTRSS
jgi:hypothetical protein